MARLTISPDTAIAAAHAQSPDEGRAMQAAISASLLDHIFSGRALLEDFTDEEQKYLPADIVQRLRRAAYARVVEAMDADERIATWDAAMTARFGDGCNVFGHAVSWPVALRLVRWGEEPRHWPAAWDADDVARGQSWLAGKHPRTVVYANGSSPNPGARIRIS